MQETIGKNYFLKVIFNHFTCAQGQFIDLAHESDVASFQLA